MRGATFEFATESSDATRSFGEELGKLLGPGGFVALYGELGSGKTVLAQGIALGLGFRGLVASPTFVIVSEYEGRLPMHHVDLYRIEGADDLIGIGYREFFYGDGVTVVEWADRVPELLPEDRLDIHIEFDAVGEPRESYALCDPDLRRFVLSASGPIHEALLRKLIPKKGTRRWPIADPDD